MRYHVTFTVRESTPLSEIAEVQNRIGGTIEKILKTGKVKESGLLIGDRAGFFVIDVGSIEELFNLLAPFYDVAKPDIQPVISFDLLPKIFEELQKIKY